MGNEEKALFWWANASAYGNNLANQKYQAMRDQQQRKRDKILNNYKITPDQNNNSSTNSLAKRKACPFCEGKGYTSTHETFTDGRQDKNNVTQYGQTSKKTCSYCKGSGFIAN